MKPLRLALIGLGSQGRKHLLAAQALEKGGLVTVVASCDPQIKNEVEGVPRHYQSYKKMFLKEKIDAVVIATPNIFHLEIVTAALAKGCLAIKEKPLAMNIREARQIAQMMEKSKGAVIVCQQRFYKQCWLELQSVLPLMGKPVSFSYQFVVNDQNESWYWDAKIAGGGVWLNMGWHALQVLQWLWGDFAQIEVTSNSGGARPWQYDTDHTAFARVAMCNGLMGSVLVSCVHFAREILRIETERGLVLLENEKLWLYREGEWEFVSTDQNTNPYQLQLRQIAYWWQQEKKGKQFLHTKFNDYLAVQEGLGKMTVEQKVDDLSPYLIKKSEKASYATTRH